MRHAVFVAGGTGYIGQRLIRRLIGRGHEITALARPGSENKIATGCRVVSGDALRGDTYQKSVRADHAFVHLVGVAHPAPWKERQFREIDLESLRQSAEVARIAGCRHFVFVSVAHPAPAMRAYVKVRLECEVILRKTGLTATILRPWYVLGPGHWWPVLLQPGYRILEHIPATREGALRLGLVTLEQMVEALVWAVENPPKDTMVLDVPAIRGIRNGAPAGSGYFCRGAS